MAGALLSRSRTYALATVQMESQASPGEQPADESWLLSRAISAHSVATTECSIHRRSPRPIRRSGRMASQPSVTFCDWSRSLARARQVPFGVAGLGIGLVILRGYGSG